MSMVTVTRDGHVATVTLDRPEKRNAMRLDFWVDLPARVEELDADAAVRAIVLRGAGTCFSAGLDIPSTMAALPQPDGEPDGASVVALYRLIRQMQRAVSSLERSRVPTIAAVHGACIGGGLDLATACDLRLATADAHFALPETGLGIIPAAGGTWRLPRVVGQPLARQIILFGRELDGEEAVQAGLADLLVPGDKLMDEARSWALRAANRDPLATQLAKAALGRAHGSATGREFVEECQSKLYGRPDLGGSE